MEPPLESAIATLAAQQGGVVSLAQLQELGLDQSAVHKRAATGRLHRVHRGVYAVGHPLLGRSGRWTAAVLAGGPGALLSHDSSGALMKVCAGDGPVPHVTLPRRSARRRPGIHVHVTTTLTAADKHVHDGIPCTSLARTLVDLGDVVSPRAVERAVDQAEALRMFDLTAVDDALSRVGPRRGAGALRAVLASYASPALTASELEERFLALCDVGALPRPAVNAWLTLPGGHSFQVDFLFAGPRLVVETDGFAFHSSRRAFEDDRRRDQVLQISGYGVLRFTWRQILEEPTHVAATLRRLLADLSTSVPTR